MIRVFALAACVLLAGCNTVVPYKDVYDGLLPAGHKLEQSSEPLRAEQLKRSTVVLVTTANFNTYTETWQKHWEKGGAERQQQKFQGAAAALAMFNPAAGMAQGLSQGPGAGIDGVRQASDPRIVVDRVYATFRPYFREVKAASDFAEALDMKADYIALIDYFGTFNEWGDEYRAKGGVHLLDGSLRRVFSAEGAGNIPRGMGNVFAGSQGQYDILVKTYAAGLQATLGQVLPVTRAKLEGR